MFVGGVVAANWAASQWGLLPVGWGLLVPAGTLFAGVVLVARDLLHRTAGLRWVFAAIAVGCAVSVVAGLLAGSPIPGLSAVRIAVASGAAFALSELLDTGVYARLRERNQAGAMLLSNTAGAAADTLLFLWWSGFGVTWAGFAGQMLAKALWVSVPAVAVIAAADRWLARRAVAACAT
jgi:uncharacterized PurR-regulated membrane protein YhhQ (DUF165 family)